MDFVTTYLRTFEVEKIYEGLLFLQALFFLLRGVLLVEKLHVLLIQRFWWRVDFLRVLVKFFLPFFLVLLQLVVQRLPVPRRTSAAGSSS